MKLWFWNKKGTVDLANGGVVYGTLSAGTMTRCRIVQLKKLLADLVSRVVGAGGLHCF